MSKFISPGSLFYSLNPLRNKVVWILKMFFYRFSDTRKKICSIFTSFAGRCREEKKERRRAGIKVKLESFERGYTEYREHQQRLGFISARSVDPFIMEVGRLINSATRSKLG